MRVVNTNKVMCVYNKSQPYLSKKCYITYISHFSKDFTILFAPRRRESFAALYMYHPLPTQHTRLFLSPCGKFSDVKIWCDK